MNNQPDYEEVLKFPNETSDFSRGFACGIIWEKLKNGDDEFSQLVSSENKLIISSICSVMGWEYETNDIGDGWMFVTFRK